MVGSLGAIQVDTLIQTPSHTGTSLHWLHTPETEFADAGVVQYESGNGSVCIAGEGHDSWAKECVLLKMLERGGRLTGQLKHEARIAHQDCSGDLQIVAPILAAEGRQFSSPRSVRGQHEISIAG